MQPLSLYVHIPFCQVKCPYCDFYSVAGQGERIAAYGKALLAQIEYFARVYAARYRVQTIFFGGGTPSYVPSSLIRDILERLIRRFHVESNAEITLEMNPGSCEIAKLSEYRGMGINRISLGIQSFHDKELRFLGRVHCAQEAHAAVQAVRDCGFDNFNLDLIFALPGQTAVRWQETLNQALAYHPPHVSAYNLTYEEGTPLAQAKKAGNFRPLSDQTERKLYTLAIAALKAAGLWQYEISNFARAGRECRHNLSYWNGTSYLGLGPGAHSYMEGRRFFNTRNLAQYIKNTVEHAVDTIADDELSPAGRFWELLAIGLRALAGVHADRLAQAWNLSLESDVMPRLRPWIQDGFLEYEEKRLRLTTKGLFYYDRMAAALIEPAPAQVLAVHNR